MNIAELTKKIESELVRSYSLTELLDACNKYKYPYPERLSKPRLPHGANSEQASQYAKDLKQYESNQGTYLAKKEFARNREHQINTIIREKIKILSGLNNVVPEKYRDKVYKKAYDDGHSSGWHEIYSQLVDLVEIFE